MDRNGDWLLCNYLLQALVRNAALFNLCEVLENIHSVSIVKALTLAAEIVIGISVTHCDSICLNKGQSVSRPTS